MLNTLKSTLGFIGAVIRRRVPIWRSETTLEGIFNYHRVPNLFPTSGQPNEQELRLIAESGYRTVINLAPNSMLENSVVEERKILESLGVRYEHISVDFQNPSDETFETFVAVVEAADLSTLWVHCAANMRVSAFVYRYRTQRLGHEYDEARQDLDVLWQPFGVWKRFINRA